MNEKIVFFNTGWMDFYKGISNDKITGGGKHVDSQGWGGEMFNFKKFQGRFYGFVQPKIDKKYGNPSTIKLEKFGGSETDEKLTDVTVIWTAKDPINGGTYIIGWYFNATVYRYIQKSPKNSNRQYETIPLGFYATTKIKNARLLSVDERIIHIRRQEKNWMGQSNVWYADNNPDFIKLVQDYVFNGKIPLKRKKPKKPTGKPKQPDPLKRLMVEKNAIKKVTKHYTKLGYEVQSVEKDNVGWDLTASNERTELKLEVKGLSGNAIATELTPNEFKNLNADKKFYRLCVVTEALTKKPKLKIFAYSNDTGEWTSENGTILIFEEIKSARIYV
jgi:hypothetical protein